MANGLKTELRRILGVCEECRYSAEELMADYPVGTGASSVEATATITHGVNDVYLIIWLHRSTCSSHTSQRTIFKGE